MASKESEGYPDMKLAFYSNLAVPSVTLSPEFPSATVNVELGPKAGIIEIESLNDASSGSTIQYATMTLRRIQNPKFFMTIAIPPGDHVLVPSQADVSIEVSARGYRPWPTQMSKESGEVHLNPGEVHKLQIGLEPEPTEKKD